MSHRCHAHGCRVEVPPRMLFCAPHWWSTRKPLRDAVWREYRPGQERDKNPSYRYLAIQQLAVSELAHRPPGCSAIAAEYALRSEEFRRKAMERGDGDPYEQLERRKRKPSAQLSLSFGGGAKR